METAELHAPRLPEERAADDNFVDVTDDRAGSPGSGAT